VGVSGSTSPCNVTERGRKRGGRGEGRGEGKGEGKGGGKGGGRWEEGSSSQHSQPYSKEGRPLLSGNSQPVQSVHLHLAGRKNSDGGGGVEVTDRLTHMLTVELATVAVTAAKEGDRRETVGGYD
jgi:hypothetical protein